MYVSEEHPNILQFDIFRDSVGILNFVTTSLPPDSDTGVFNIGFSGVEDCVVNRVKLALTFGLTPENFVFQTQAHTANYHIVTREDAGAGFYLKQTAIQDNDILITNQPGLCLITRSADCVPILMYAPKQKAIAAIHSGREGCRLGAAPKAAEILHKEFGAAYSDILVGIGPHICKNCYTVDKECADAYNSRQYYAPDIVQPAENGQFTIDMKKTIISDLMHMGVPMSNIEQSNLCTKHHAPSFFSARNGDEERFCAGIMLL
ncbi:MAG: laccase domain-containing protein [Bacteroidales bacterium]|nr:laccase domain-containing protein [Bacteroidales bacterium]